MPSAAFKKALAAVEKKVPNCIADAKEAGIVKYVKTHSPRLNYIYGGGKGIAIGRIHRYMGPESGGKSTICTWIASEFQKEIKSQLGLDKPYCVYVDFEGTFDLEHATELGLLPDEEHFVFLQPESIEDAGEVLEELVKTGEVGTIIFDSESMASTRTINENELGKATFGGVAKMLGEFLTRFSILCRKYKSTMFIISQERANMQMMSHAIVTTGGYKLKYAASTLMRVKKITDLKDKDGNLAGIQMNVRNYKNKTGIPWRECNMDLWFNKGFDYTGEYIDFIKDLTGDPRLDPLVKVGGAYFKSEKFDFSICGRDKFLEWAKMPENADKWKEITTTIDTIIDGTMEDDKAHYDPEMDKDLPDDIKEEIKLESSLDEAPDALVEQDEIKLSEDK